MVCTFWTPNSSWEDPFNQGLSGLLSIFLSVQAVELYHEFILNFGMVIETNIKLCVTARFSWKLFFASKMRKWTKNVHKQSFLNLLEKLFINFYWICSIMKVYIICSVSAQISYLGKSWFLRYGRQCSQSIK